MTTLALCYILGLCSGIFGLAFWLEFQLKKQEDVIYDTNRIDVHKYRGGFSDEEHPIKSFN